MAGIFKSLDQSDIRITPFRAHKLWSANISGSSTFTLYKADYYPATTKWYFADNGSSDSYGGAAGSASFVGPAQEPPFKVGDVVTIAQDPGYVNSSYEGQAVVLASYYTQSVWVVHTNKAFGSSSPANPGTMTRTLNLSQTFEQGNPIFDSIEPTTANDKLQRVVHRSVDHLFYRDFYTNNKATFGSGNINKQVRKLSKEAWVISMPQSKFGESILPGSVIINANYVLSPTMSLAQTQSLQIVDDGFGNLLVSGSIITPYTSSGGAFVNVSGSVSKPLSGEWPLDNGYKYQNKDFVSFTSSFNRGNWCVRETHYKNIKFDHIQTGSALNPVYRLYGVVPFFTASLSSSWTIVPGEYNPSYNFENSNFSISTVIMPQVVPTSTSGSIIVTKEGPSEDLRIDENGNVFSVSTSTKTPYRLLFTSESKIRFERDGSNELAAITSSAVSINEVHHVAVVKSGSLLSLYVDNTLQASGSDISVPAKCSNQANIFIGSDNNYQRNFTGVIASLKFFSQALTATGSNQDVNILRHTQNIGSNIVGNVFYNQGMMVLTAEPTKYMDIVSADARGTHTIWETEVSCTINPGEFGMSMNRTVQEYNPEMNQFVYKAFMTGSSFRPFVTTVGLYNDDYQLVAVGKLSSPIQLAANTDTTIIVKFDR